MRRHRFRRKRGGLLGPLTALLVLCGCGSGDRGPVRSYNRKTLAVWNRLAKSGLSSATVGWWASYPSEDLGPGVIVSDALASHGFGRTAREGNDGLKTHPADFFTAVDALIPPEQQIQAGFVQRFIHMDAGE